MKTIIAIIMYKIGLPVRVSTDITDELSFGYGKLDSNGFWEYQLPNKYIKYA